VSVGGQQGDVIHPGDVPRGLICFQDRHAEGCCVYPQLPNHLRDVYSPDLQQNFIDSAARGGGGTSDRDDFTHRQELSRKLISSRPTGSDSLKPPAQEESSACARKHKAVKKTGISWNPTSRIPDIRPPPPLLYGAKSWAV
jgi:hypothetical protein